VQYSPSHLFQELSDTDKLDAFSLDMTRHEFEETERKKMSIPASDAQIRDPSIPWLFAQSTICLKVSASSYDTYQVAVEDVAS
jgi:hypothetical protein